MANCPTANCPTEKNPRAEKNVHTFESAVIVGGPNAPRGDDMGEAAGEAPHFLADLLQVVPHHADLGH